MSEHSDADDHEGAARSLSGDATIFPFLPALLADLDALGCSPRPMVELLAASPWGARRDLLALDLGCGKGAALIALAKRFGWRGLGVDLVPDFIGSARVRAGIEGQSERLRFVEGDLALFLDAGPSADIVLYGFDGEVLGDVASALRRIGANLAPGGAVCLDLVWRRPGIDGPAPTESEVRHAIRAAGFAIVSERVLDPGFVRSENSANTAKIRRRARALAARRPDLSTILEDYVARQEAESRELEEDLDCVILLVARDH